MELPPDAKDIFKQSEHHFLEEAIIDVLAHLSPLESDVLTQTFLKGQSIENAAKTLKLTRALVRDTKEAALNKIRTNPDLTQKLIDFYV
jgi:DNA-directed RNA polymerase sigma subunit (sigma70/sigma32)